ncbi:uncharacterized protein DUF397 [Micromonospora sp. Llam0]|nr:uncharacterized protein DUF397 [Micromonospora sp. Llam0]
MLHYQQMPGKESVPDMRARQNLPRQVLVRDSKDRTGGTLTFTPTAWSTFVTQASTTGS